MLCGELAADFVPRVTGPLRMPAQLVAAWEAVTTPLLVHDEERIVHANAAMLRLLGYDAQVLAAMPFDAWAVPAQRDSLRDYGLQALAQGTPSNRGDGRLQQLACFRGEDAR